MLLIILVTGTTNLFIIYVSFISNFVDHLPSRAKLRCTIQLRGQICSPYFSSNPLCTLWCKQQCSILIWFRNHVAYIAGFPIGWLTFWTCALIGWCFLCTEYTECQAFYPVVRIGSSPPPRSPPPLGTREWDKLACERGGGGWGDPVPTMGQTLSYSRYTIIPPHFYVSSMKKLPKWYCFNDQIQGKYLFKTLNNLITSANSKLPARRFNDIYCSPESEI